MLRTYLRYAPQLALTGFACALLFACDGLGPEDVASVTVSPAEATLEVGGTVQLSATLMDDQGQVLSDGLTASWSSSSSAVATVDTTGLVTGVAAGSATITASIGTAGGTAQVLVAGPAPSITSVSPSTGTVGTELKIIGTNFRAGAAVLIGTTASDSVDVTAAETIFAIVPAGIAAGTGLDVTVTNTDGTSTTAAGAFTAVAPELDFVNSATKPSGQIGSTVIVEGDAFGDLQGTGKVLFSDGAGGTVEAVIASEDDWTNTFIVTTVPSGTGDGDMVVTTATGTSNALPFKVASAATFSPSTINWTVTTDLPAGVSGHHAVFVPIDDPATGTTNQYVHVTGGADDNAAPLNKVYVGLINTDGTVSSWPNTADLPEVRAFHTSVAATPFNSRVSGSGELYVLGGISAAGGQPLTTVYRASLNTDGTVDTWTTTTSLPQPLHSLGAVVFRSAIYVAGGATTDNAPVATVYRARIDTLGELGAWEELPALPSARAYHGFATFGGYLYSVGGETAAVTPDDGSFTNNDTKLDEVVFVKINLRTGDLADPSWTINANSLGKNRSKHSALVAGGNVFVSAGLYAAAGTGSSENTFAQVFADGTVNTFAGATGDNTLLSEGGANLFNHAAIGYVDANGVAHVMILGGDDVNNLGTKRVKVLFY